MKKLILFSALALLCITSFGKSIDENTAKQAGQNFLTNRIANTHFKTGVTLERVLYSPANQSSNSAGASTPYYYIFNVSNGDGFIIVSGDDQSKPVLAYSYEHDFNVTDIAPQTAYWLDGYKNQLQYIIEHNLAQTPAIAQEWKNLAGGASATKFGKKAGVGPLVQTEWNQLPYYNALCPFDDNANERTVTGCVATAMAQVMKFWNYPEQGSGFHSYDHEKFGTLSANFGATVYDWSAMPLDVTSNNTAVATLMFQVGVSVDMHYGVANDGGSGAYVITSQSPVLNCTEYALPEYFGYKNTLQGLERNNYSDVAWLNLIKAELDAGRPIIYAGFGSGGGHCFVNDGYDDNDFLHFNWGWGGAYDGFFAADALNPGGVGTGGGTGGFNSNHQAVIGIQPPSGTEVHNYDLAINQDVFVSPSTIGYGSSFSISTNIVNNGTTTFLGKYCAAIFDQNDFLVEYTDSLIEDNGLPPGYTYSGSISFPSAGSFKILPGTGYKIYILYKPQGGNWQRLTQNTSSILDYGTLTVINQNDIELYSNMVPSPTTFVSGESASVTLDIANYGSSSFSGLANLSLFALDGTFAAQIEEKSSISLPSNSHFQSGLTFSTSSLNLTPGTYLLALQIKRDGNQSYELVGSTDYQNPIKITVVEAPFLPDVYEVNNTVSEAFNLPLSYTNNIAKVKTTGSNCHNGSDYDYYKLNLPTDYTYSISARVYDENNPGSSQTYSLDALVSYSKNGTSWSETFDDIIPNAIPANGGTTLYFLVAPYFSGKTGTYLLDITVTRTSTTGINEVDWSAGINIYPNPAKDLLAIDLANFEGAAKSVSLTNIQGQQITVIAHPSADLTIPLTDVEEGIYILNIETDKGTIKRKVCVQR